MEAEATRSAQDILRETIFAWPSWAQRKLPPRTSGFPGSAAVSAYAAYFLSKGVLGAPASRWQQFWKNRVWGKQLYVNSDDGVSVFGWAGETPNAIYFLISALEGRKVKTLQINLLRPFRALSKPLLSRGSAPLHLLLSCRRSAAEKVNDIRRDADAPRMPGFCSH